MNDLKRSLEKAIEELRETKPVDQVDHDPAPDSIEAALSSAPAVSSDYLPPGTRPTTRAERLATHQPPGTKAPKLSLDKPGRSLLGDAQWSSDPEPLPELDDLLYEPPRRGASHGQAGPRSSTFEARQKGFVPPPLPVPEPERRRNDSGGADKMARGGFGAVEQAISSSDPEAEHRKRFRDNILRWMTISVSAIAGLVGGWLGSTISDQPRPVMQADQIERSIDSGPTSGRSIGVAGITGKTDRAAPVDDLHCTVLELDRGTGLTLAKPCRPVETAEISSKLTKSDLLAKP